VTSPRDPLDDWLERDVTPLSPPPGTLDHIRRRARRRKTRQATFAAAGCAVILAAGIATPQLLSGARPPGNSGPAVAASPRPPVVKPGGSNSPGPDTSGETQLHQHSRLSVTTSGTVPPRNFQPTSVTFVGNGQDGVVGAVIGQAGTPGHCATKNCTSLAGTSTYGSSWYGVSAPLTPGPDGDAGVSQLRFATLSEGWAYGPALYETSGGGWPWHREQTGGQRVLDIEAAPAQPTAGVPARGFAVFGTCTGSGAAYATGCTGFSLWTSVAGSRTWTAVSVPIAYQHMTSATGAVPLLVISGGTTGYLLTPSDAVLSGPASGGSWQVAGRAPCAPAAAGTGDGAELAAGPTLLLTCVSRPASGTTSQVTVYTSSTGATWTQAGTLTTTGAPTAVAAAGSAQAVLATASGLEYSADGGRSWHAGKFAGNAPPGGFSYVGMTTATQGVAIPADAALGEIWVTANGGKTWRASPISG
jgi:hypothetical protein